MLSKEFYNSIFKKNSFIGFFLILVATFSIFGSSNVHKNKKLLKIQDDKTH